MRGIVISSMCIPFSIGLALYYGSEYGYYIVAMILFLSGWLCGVSTFNLVDINLSGKVITPLRYRSKS